MHGKGDRTRKINKVYQTILSTEIRMIFLICRDVLHFIKNLVM